MTQSTVRHAPDVSFVLPMYNEEDNVKDIIGALTEAFDGRDFTYEILLINDGSTDNTRAVGEEVASTRSHVQMISYAPNRGRGYALRTGMASAKGDLVVTTEADLSYGTDCLLGLIQILRDNPEVDVAIAAPYTVGGKLENVPPFRAWVSRTGNRVLSLVFPGNLTTMTGMTRAYRRQVIESIELESDGKEIHIEILSKVLALGFRVKEIPATLSARTKGKSKFKFGATARSHLLFSVFERPMLLFGLVGFVCILLGVLGGLYVAFLRFTGQLTPGRPLIFLVVLLILGGIQFFSFGFIGTQITLLRKEMYRVQQRCKHLDAKLHDGE